MTFTRKHIAIAVLPLFALSFAGCDSPSDDTEEFDVSYTFSPDPAIATPSTGVQYKVTNADDTVSYYDYDYRTTFTVTLTELEGMDLDITAMNLTVQQATGGIVISPSGGDSVYYKFNSQAVTKHINANGTASVSFDVWYDLPSGNKEALVTLSFSFQHEDTEDDTTYTYSDTATVNIAP